MMSSGGLFILLLNLLVFFSCQTSKKHSNNPDQSDIEALQAPDLSEVCKHSSKKVDSIEGVKTPVSADGSNLAPNLREIAKAVGFTCSGCTAFYIGDGLVVTDGHCLHGKPAQGVTLDPLTDLNCGEMSVKLGWVFGRDDSSSHRCTRIVSYLFSSQEKYGSAGDYDIAVLKIDGVPTTKIALSDEVVMAGDKVAVLHHAGQKPMQYQECSVLSTSAPHWITTDCELGGGASGAPVISLKTNSVIGIFKNSLGQATDLTKGHIAKIVRESKQ